MNTRKYPRSTQEAFNDAEYASALTRYDRQRDGFTYVACGIAAVSLICILFVWG